MIAQLFGDRNDQFHKIVRPTGVRVLTGCRLVYNPAA